MKMSPPSDEYLQQDTLARVPSDQVPGSDTVLAFSEFQTKHDRISVPGRSESAGVTTFGAPTLDGSPRIPIQETKLSPLILLGVALLGYFIFLRGKT